MRLTYDTVEVHTKRTFKIAVESRDSYPSVIAKLEHEGRVGYGEAIPASRVTGEDARSIGSFLDRAAEEVKGLRPTEWSRFLDHMHAEPGNPGARCAVDLALHDLVGKLQGVPARALYGLPPARLETSMTVSLDAPDIMAEEARGYRAAGFRCLKLKLGEAGGDVARVEAVRAACPDARIRADANTAWGVADAKRILPALAKFGVEFVEQPVPDEAGLVDIARASPIPIYADESVLDARDVERLHKMGFVGGVNVKLQKAGGLRPALEALRAGRAKGYALQLGCNVETSVGIAGAVQMLSLLDHADLDGNLLLADDPFAGLPLGEGWLSTPDAPGLGVAPRGAA